MLKQLMILFFNTIKEIVLNCITTVTGESTVEVDSSLEKNVNNEVDSLNTQINSLNTKVMNVINKCYNTFNTPFKSTDTLSNLITRTNTLNMGFKMKICQFDPSITYADLNSLNTLQLSNIFANIENTEKVQYTILKGLSAASTTLSSVKPITNESGYSAFTVKYLYKVNVSKLTFTPEYLIFYYNDLDNSKHNIFCVYHITKISSGKFTEYSFEMISYCKSSNTESYIKGDNTTFNLTANVTQQLSTVFVQGRYTAKAYSSVINCMAIGASEG